MKVKVARVREGGNTRLGPDSLVFSLGSRLAAKVPVLKPGDELVISTATRPNLTGVTTAIGGGPKLVTDGKAWKWKNPKQDRHPRSAIGWNRDFIFLVVVEGEQKTSVGMSFPELATYLVGLGCEEALNFDGGGSSALWYQGKTVIQASQNDERLVANALVLCERPVIKGLGGKERESLSPQGVKK
jgi:exopolysaccharide biosynthesis protein